MYLALANENGVEVSAKGYFRYDLSRTVFKMSPSKDQSLVELVFVNLDTIEFPTAQASWGWIAAVFISDDPSEGVNTCIIPLETAGFVRTQDKMVLFPGQLTIATGKITPSGRKIPEPEPQPKPFFGWRLW